MTIKQNTQSKQVKGQGKKEADSIKKSAFEMAAMEQAMAKLVCSYHTDVADLDNSSKPIKYVMTGNGVMKVVQNKIGLFVAKTDEIAGLPVLEEGVALTIPKIPYLLFQQTIAFFREVMRKKHGAEAMLQFFYDHDNDKYIVYCPKQVVSAGGIHFEANKEYYEKHTLVMDIHSHNSMPAFFSSIDTNDEKETRIFGVVGNLNRVQPTWKFRICVEGAYKEVDISDIFDYPFQGASFPEEWLDNCTRAYGKYSHHTPKAKWGDYKRSTSGTTFTGGKVVSRQTKSTFLDKELRSHSFSHSSPSYTEESGYNSPYNSSYDLTGIIGMDEEYENMGLYTAPVVEDKEVDSRPVRPEDVVYELTATERVALIKELLAAFPEDVVYAIHSEDAWDELQKELLKLSTSEVYTYA